jgi:hypothetical protein
LICILASPDINDAGIADSSAKRNPVLYSFETHRDDNRLRHNDYGAIVRELHAIERKMAFPQVNFPILLPQAANLSAFLTMKAINPSFPREESSAIKSGRKDHNYPVASATQVCSSENTQFPEPLIPRE